MRFEKVTEQQFLDTIKGLYNDSLDELEVDWKEYYTNCLKKINLPQRGTSNSAGYDFVSPMSVKLPPHTSTVIPTGVRWVSDNNSSVLLIVPRSSLGFKYGMALANTVGVIDEDYFKADNEGHIMVKVVNNSEMDLTIHTGDRFCQGIIVPYAVVDDDVTFAEREGGIGSTGK